MKIVVIGGTGLIGSKLVTVLRDRGHEAVPASPNSGVNTLTGEGVAEVVEGADVVVDVSNSPSFEDQAVLDFFRTSTGNLLAAEEKAGVGHHVALSVVGTRGLTESGYFRAKIAQEELIASSPVPYSIVHATQFFEFLKSITDGATQDGVVHLAPVRFQPIAAADVAVAVADVATGAPVRGVVEVAGPQEFRLDELVRTTLASLDDPREVVADPDARYFGAPLSESSLVPGDGAVVGATRLADWRQQQAAAAR
ncbi:SDR family oxidoreductase [Cellulosimicrobium protaetiae]|uniref:SDR family oxidoreductase n=1 Tax=Cellulosimicrobium protaetiae TaxID=2587808 RepID=A0A6M5UDU1_9MICO|nr:SDR family oxidoreductase [Cellulosimicrobium protaetiae]QJW36757.1 SDR family oxidoreductase [Cellulosimicrobium protaetiae]